MFAIKFTLFFVVQLTHFMRIVVQRKIVYKDGKWIPLCRVSSFRERMRPSEKMEVLGLRFVHRCAFVVDKYLPPKINLEKIKNFYCEAKELGVENSKRVKEYARKQYLLFKRYQRLYDL